MTGNAFDRDSSGPDGADAGIGGVLPEARTDTPPILDQRFDADSLYALRATVEAHVTRAGMPQGRTDDVVISVHELATNAVRHGAGTGRLRIWLIGAELWCEVDDDGPGGLRHPGKNLAESWPCHHGHGLWLVRQMADGMWLRCDASGTRAVTVFRLPEPGPHPFRLTSETRGGCTVLTADGDLDRTAASALVQEVTALAGPAAAPMRLVVDLSGVTFWDSAGLAALITAQRRVDGDPSAAMVVAAAPSSIRRRLDEGELTARFVVAETTDEAVRKLGSAAPE